MRRARVIASMPPSRGVSRLSGAPRLDADRRVWDAVTIASPVTPATVPPLGSQSADDSGSLRRNLTQVRLQRGGELDKVRSRWPSVPEPVSSHAAGGGAKAAVRTGSGGQQAAAVGTPSHHGNGTARPGKALHGCRSAPVFHGRIGASRPHVRTSPMPPLPQPDGSRPGPPTAQWRMRSHLLWLHHL